ncbi:MAG: hypothetical protein V7784_12935 [Oceanospirillaceae bacterium]
MNFGSKKEKECAKCDLTTSLESRREDQKIQPNKNTQDYHDHKNRIKMEQSGLDDIERSLREY